MGLFSSTKTPKGQKKKHHKYSHGESMKQMLRDELRQTPPAARRRPTRGRSPRRGGPVQGRAREDPQEEELDHALEDLPKIVEGAYNAVDLDSNGRLSAIEIYAAVLLVYVKLASQIEA